MNDQSPSICPKEVSDLEVAAHLFRSKVIDKCALVESRCVEIIRSTSNRPHDIPHLFGQKIEAIRDLANKEQSPFLKPKRVLEALDALAPYARLRSEIAHSTLRVVNDLAGEHVIMFQNAAYDLGNPLDHRIALSESEIKQVQVSVNRCANHFRQVSGLKEIIPS